MLPMDASCTQLGLTTRPWYKRADEDAPARPAEETPVFGEALHDTRAAAKTHNVTSNVRLAMLVNKDRVAVGIDDHKACRPLRRLVCCGLKLYAAIPEVSLKLTDVGEGFEFFLRTRPTGVEGHHVLVEHALK